MELAINLSMLFGLLYYAYCTSRSPTTVHNMPLLVYVYNLIYYMMVWPLPMYRNYKLLKESKDD